MKVPSLDLLVPGWSDIRERRPLLAPLLLGWVFVALSTWSAHSFVLEALPPGSEGIRSMIVASLVLVAVFAPLLALVRAAGLALVTWASSTLLGAHRDLRELLSIFLYGDCLRALLATLLVLWFHAVAVTTGRPPTSLTDPLSLAGIVPSSHVGLLPLLNMISVGGAVWVVYTFLALRRVSGLRPAAAFAIVAVATSGALLVTYLRASLGAS